MMDSLLNPNTTASREASTHSPQLSNLALPVIGRIPIFSARGRRGTILVSNPSKSPSEKFLIGIRHARIMLVPQTTLNMGNKQFVSLPLV